jgi:hypothetical protein
MGISVTCPVCGHHFQVRDDEARPEVECLLCGTLCALRVSVPSKAPADPAPREAVRPAPFPPPEPAEEKPAPALDPSVFVKKAPPAPRPPGAPAPRSKHSDLTAEEAEDAPYEMVGGLERRCPHCNQVLAEESVVCVACGFDLQTGKKSRKIYAPVDRSWEAGLSLRRRVTLFLVFQGVVLLSVLAGAWLTGSLATFLVPWLLFTGLQSFVLGTYDRVDLSRNKRGKVFLSKTWRVCFHALPPEPIKVSDYEGVVTGLFYETTFWDWIIFLNLFLSGVLPGLWWYFSVMSRDTYFVALARDHGYPETVLYRGWNQSHMEEIAGAVREVAGLP